MAVCPYCGKGLCDACLRAEHHKERGPPRHRCRYDVPTMLRELQQINRHNRLATQIQSAFCTIAGAVFMLTAVVVGRNMSMHLGVQIGVLAGTCMTVGVIWWWREFRPGRLS